MSLTSTHVMDAPFAGDEGFDAQRRLWVVRVERLDSGAWRVTFRVLPAKGKQAVDLRCYLTLYGEALTETWTYQLVS